VSGLRDDGNWREQRLDYFVAEDRHGSHRSNAFRCRLIAAAVSDFADGGGRKQAVVLNSSLKGDLEQLLESTTRGDPESPLRWTCLSVRNLETELKNKGHSVSHQVVADLLHELEYSLQANSKTREGAPSRPEGPV
jgi:hypothetical protein